MKRILKSSEQQEAMNFEREEEGVENKFKVIPH